MLEKTEWTLLEVWEHGKDGKEVKRQYMPFPDRLRNDLAELASGVAPGASWHESLFELFNGKVLSHVDAYLDNIRHGLSFRPHIVGDDAVKIETVADWMRRMIREFPSAHFHVRQAVKWEDF